MAEDRFLKAFLEDLPKRWEYVRTEKNHKDVCICKGCGLMQTHTRNSFRNHCGCDNTKCEYHVFHASKGNPLIREEARIARAERERIREERQREKIDRKRQEARRKTLLQKQKEEKEAEEYRESVRRQEIARKRREREDKIMRRKKSDSFEDLFKPMPQRLNLTGVFRLASKVLSEKNSEEWSQYGIQLWCDYCGINEEAFRKRLL